MRPLPFMALLGILATGCPKGGVPDEGVDVAVRVVDEQGAPVKTAVVRNTEEKERHPVSTATGIWSADALYLNGGQTVPFKPGTSLVFEITAPGYLTETVNYVVRKRDNVIDVVLKELNLDTGDAPDPMIKFGRDIPLDGTPVDEGPPGS